MRGGSDFEFERPLESDTNSLAQKPLMTWSMAGLVAILSTGPFFNGEGAIERFALIPAEPFRYGGLTLITSFFLHGSVLHLLGNLYFLLIFGDDVEDYLGRGQWLLLLLAATLAGDVLHVAVDPRSLAPLIGASGGISGLLTFYVLKFPRARLCFLVGYGWWYVAHGWIRIPAWVAFMLWILMQFWGTTMQIAGFGRISALAHLGGAAAGFLLWLAWRKRG